MNIALIVLDTVRGDVANALIEDGELPTLASLAKYGRWYTDARSNAPWTVPSHGSLFTGKYPSDSNITGTSPSYESVPLIERVNSAGYDTAGFSSNPWLSANFDFDRSFDKFYTSYDFYSDGGSMNPILTNNGSLPTRFKEFLSELGTGSFSKSLVNTAFWCYQRTFRDDAGGHHLTSRAADWLSEKTSSRFAFVNLTESHLPYKLPEDWLPDGINMTKLQEIEQDASQYQANASDITSQEYEILKLVYQATIKYSDHLLGELVDNASDDTVFIILGDHGEHFGEYERFGHQYSLYNELLHVPLIISGPHVNAQKINKTVSLRSLYQFVLKLADGEVTELPKQPYHIAELISPQPSVKTLEEKGPNNPHQFVYRYGNGARCIENREMKVVEFPDGEVSSIEKSSDIQGDVQERLYSILRDERGKIEGNDSDELIVSETVKSQLEDLGYA
ncbi:sulfatase [Haladaptatus halobius]|uniref:sulfatase n=1 Tax=Haladaptatus halobius TaxID=2884875 RepID=UPI001D0AE772|nr:sulfatase [Haladaptatus halobius]